MPHRGLQTIFASALTALVAGGSAFAEETVPNSASEAAPLVATSNDSVLDATATAIRGLLDGSDFADRPNAAAVSDFYTQRSFAAAWTKDGTLTARARDLIDRIGAADSDGLDPSAFDLPRSESGKHAKLQPRAAAEADVRLSLAVAAYARAAYAGQIDPGSISENIGYERQLPDLTQALTTVSNASNPVKTLASYNPPHREFAELRKKLAELRSAEKEKPPIRIPPGKTLKRGVEDARVGFLRQRLGLPTDVRSPALYDDTVVEAVTAFQKSARLKADGIVGRRTIAALNADPIDPIPAILVNMEKWRWMPRDLGQFYVRVNIPDFSLDVIKGEESIHTTRIVVGKPSQQTPVFSDEIEHTVVNPAWYVPASITRKELLPAARRNPGALRGYQVFALRKGRYRPIDPRRARRIDPRKIQIRQPPGPRNALGKVKFMFPNRYSVYLHDTPSKSLFKRDYRAYSHGCMRVMNPMDFADALLAQEPEIDANYLESLYGKRERRVDLSRKVPVHVTYFTAWVDESGGLQMRDDLYGHDGKIEKRLTAS